jgi:GT2 family glycosyltransferase
VDDPRLSTVIATAGRPDKLAASLEGHAALDSSTPPFEVVVVLDGENPASRAVAARSWPFPITVAEQDARGIAAAKNLGARTAKGELLLFLNDDTRPAPDCLAQHVLAQERLGPCIAVGRVDWDSRKEITPYMKWLAPGGHQFNFERLRAHETVPWDACWGANSCAPRAWLLDEPLDPMLRFPALEDGEWGFRQTRRRRPIRYVPEARCFHDHRYAAPVDFRPRGRYAGAAARHVVTRHPSLVWALMLRPAFAAALVSLFALWPGRWSRQTGWDLDYRWNYLWGMLTVSNAGNPPR